MLLNVFIQVFEAGAILWVLLSFLVFCWEKSTPGITNYPGITNHPASGYKVECEPRSMPKTLSEEPTLTIKTSYCLPERSLEAEYQELYDKAARLKVKGLNTRWKLTTIQKKLRDLGEL